MSRQLEFDFVREPGMKKEPPGPKKAGGRCQSSSRAGLTAAKKSTSTALSSGGIATKKSEAQGRTPSCLFVSQRWLNHRDIRTIIQMRCIFTTHCKVCRECLNPEVHHSVFTKRRTKNG